MKKFVTLLIAIFTVSFAFGQNPLQQQFGKEYDEVKSFLEGRRGIEASFPDKSTIVAQTGQIVVTYFFNEGALYKMETVKSFESNKDASQTMESFLTYYKRVQARLIDLTPESEKAETHFAAVHEKELNEVYKVELDRKSVQVKTVTLSLEYCPGFEMERLLKSNRPVFNLVASSEN